MILPPEVVKALQTATLDQISDRWLDVLGRARTKADRSRITAALGRADRWFLLVTLMGRRDLWHPWLYARCREVEANPDGYLDLWGREHGKSSIITSGGIIQEVIRDPGVTIGIFSHTKHIARGFLAQIKREMETNDRLKSTYPEIFWSDPARQAPQWSLESGIIVKRKANPKEATVEASGLVDGMPTGKHYTLMVFDDVVTLESVNTPEQVQKTTQAWEIADNLGARSADGKIRKWHAGTRYHFGDTYQAIMDREALIPRVYPATEDGTPTGKPVLLTAEAWEEKKRNQGPQTIATQMLLNPAAGTEALFDKAWLTFVDVRPATLNVYIMVDPASSRKQGSDYTAMVVIGVDSAGNRYLLDGIRDRLKLHERWLWLKSFRKHWLKQPGVQMLKVGYERYGMQADLEHFELEMRRDKQYFPIEELSWPREGPHAKYDRIQRLVPDFRNARFFLPYDNAGKGETSAQTRMRAGGEAHRIFVPTKRRDYEGDYYSMNAVVLQEFAVYPYSQHDDVLDAMSRLYDMDPVPPVLIDTSQLSPRVYADGS